MQRLYINTLESLRVSLKNTSHAPLFLIYLKGVLIR